MPAGLASVLCRAQVICSMKSVQHCLATQRDVVPNFHVPYNEGCAVLLGTAPCTECSCRPHDKQVNGAADIHQAGVDILKDAESELVRQEVRDKGGVVRGSTAAKVQVPGLLCCISDSFKSQRHRQMYTCTVITNYCTHMSSVLRCMVAWRIQRNSQGDFCLDLVECLQLGHAWIEFMRAYGRVLLYTTQQSAYIHAAASGCVRCSGIGQRSTALILDRKHVFAVGS